MIQVDRSMLTAIRSLGALMLGAGWVVFAFVGGQVFLIVMVVLSMMFGAGLTAVLRPRQ